MIEDISTRLIAHLDTTAQSLNSIKLSLKLQATLMEKILETLEVLINKDHIQ